MQLSSTESSHSLARAKAFPSLPHGSLCLDAQPKRWWGPCQSSARRPRFWPVFGLFGAAVPLRFPVLRGWLWGLVFGLPEVRSRPGTGLPTLTPAQPSPSPTQASQPSPGQPKRCQSSAKGFVLPDSEAPFSATRTHRSKVERLGHAHTSSTESSPSLGAGLAESCQGPSYVPWPSICHSFAWAKASQATPKPSPPGQAMWPRLPLPRCTAQALVGALPKLCQRLFLTGFRCGVFGPETASFLARFWPVWGRRAAAFPRFEGVALGHRFESS